MDLGGCKVAFVNENTYTVSLILEVNFKRRPGAANKGSLLKGTSSILVVCV